MGDILSPAIIKRFQLDYTLSGESVLALPLPSLPKQYITGELRTATGVRCTITYLALQNRGGYGSIYLAKRKDCSGATQEVCVKIPHARDFSLCPEALIQCRVCDALEKSGIRGAVPQVFDLFQYAGETRFSMRFIKGMRSLEYILDSTTPELTLLQVICQIAGILGFLEETLQFDHRDLKADNLWIRPEPIRYRLPLGKKTWTISAPFQVVVLDFGFSCLGNKEGMAVVSLSDGILPRLDPCPKEGRDLFQLISSLWSVQQIRSVIGPSLSAEIELLLSYRNRSYINLITKTMEQRWVYILVSDYEFKHPPLHPISLLQFLSIKYPSLCNVSE
jgi:serine/threonine protein kinase